LFSEGIAKELGATNLANTMVGTPCYLSPEICDNKPYDGKSDIWALGCVLYELCALKNAFTGTSLPATILKVLRGLYKPISSKYSVDLQKLLDTLLTREPEKRPSITEVPFILV